VFPGGRMVIVVVRVVVRHGGLLRGGMSSVCHRMARA
jgi:hypothetical protein